MKNKKVLLIVIIIIILGIIGYLGYINFKMPPYVTNIEINESKRFDNQVIFNIEVDNHPLKFNKATWCLLSESDDLPNKKDNNWVQARNGYCSFTVEDGEYNIFVKDTYGNIVYSNKQKVNIDKILEIKPNKTTFYMWKGMEQLLTYELVKLGNVEENIKITSSNEKIASINDDGIIKANDYGTAYINLVSDDGANSKVKVIVSPFITKPVVNSKKSYISCKQFSEEEAELIDNILFDRINEAGYGTRAGVIAAARFITLEFSYRIHYFYENGRLNNYAPYKHVDGEGRYYHRGLYLNESKFKDITSSFVGPAIWGCDLQNYTDWGPYITGKYYPNGLDCSGFVTWAVLNGGFDVGDIGAGENAEHDDLDDLGEKVKITEELMNSGRVKAGDLIGLNGHMAILAGWDDTNYYIAESLNTTGGVVMTVVRKNKLVNNSIYDYIILMDSVYKEDGNYSNMW